jgi:threonine/homoserine/homoserine lactone efflux protein
MCIPVGPINIWVMNTALKKGEGSALALAFGGTTMDFFYFSLILSGLSVVSMSDDLLATLKMLGIGLIFALGVKELLARPVFQNVDVQTAVRKRYFGYFGLGAFLYLSNPTLVLTMTSLGAFLKSLGIFEMTWTNIVLGSLGLSIGAFTWFYCLVLLVRRYQEALRGKYLNVFNKVSGILMIGLSVFMGARLVRG